MGEVETGARGVAAELKIDHRAGRVLLRVPREADLLLGMEAAGHAVRAVDRGPVLALLAQLATLAEQRLGAVGFHEGVPYLVERSLHDEADGHA